MSQKRILLIVCQSFQRIKTILNSRLYKNVSGLVEAHGPWFVAPEGEGALETDQIPGWGIGIRPASPAPPQLSNSDSPPSLLMTISSCQLFLAREDRLAVCQHPDPSEVLCLVANYQPSVADGNLTSHVACLLGEIVLSRQTSVPLG